MGQEREVSDNKSKQGRSVRLDGIDEAIERYGMPSGNRTLVRGIYENAGASGLVGFSDYFRIERRGGGPALEVHRSYTNGFRTEQDAKKCAGDAARWPSRRLHGSWGVDHPEIGRVQEAPARKRAAPVRRPSVPERQAAVCPNCFLEIPATGICSTCGE